MIILRNTFESDLSPVRFTHSSRKVAKENKGTVKLKRKELKLCQVLTIDTLCVLAASRS
jgi:hypothetical protein